jgi:parallel beta-helix repeat protein
MNGRKERMTLIRITALTGIFLLSACSMGFPIAGPTVTQTAVAATFSPEPPERIYYVDAQHGSDSNPGSLSQPWQTIRQAVQNAQAGDLIYIRGGEYSTILGGWSFQSSGSPSRPITLSNQPGEQVVIRISVSHHDYMAFRCWSTSTDPTPWQTPKADYIRIVATDVSPHTLSNGITSQKGIVFQGVPGEQAAGIEAAGCDNWEIAGIDFVEIGYGIFAKKRNFGANVDNSSDRWYIHDNRVYNYYRESGMQFDGDDNLIENNQIYKVSDELNTSYGCQLLNILGHGNTIRGNDLDRQGSRANCGGILFEWDMADANLVERNRISNVPWGIEFAGGDNNVIRNNVVYETGGRAGILVVSYDGRSTWPCDEEAENRSSLPVNDPTDPDYGYYYAPRNCHSIGNRIYNNTIHGFSSGIMFYSLVGENTIIQNNLFSSWNTADICNYDSKQDQCVPLPSTLVHAFNADQPPFGFVDLPRLDFHLAPISPLINAGISLGVLNPNDFDGNARPQGASYDIGAYEYIFP